MSCPCCGGCPCNGPPFGNSPGEPRNIAPVFPAPADITAQILDGPAAIQGMYSLSFIYPSSFGDYQANGYRWNAAVNVPGGAVSINVRFGPQFVVCDSPRCACQCYARVVAFTTGYFFSGELGGTSQGTLVACTIPCGNITQSYNITHPGQVNFSTPASLSLTITIPVDFVALP